MNRWTCPLCRMHCLVTAGATYEPIDEVRRLTNHSTGRLGCALADALQRAGHRVTLLLSETAQHNPRSRKVRVLRFNTTHSLQRQMKEAEAQKLRPSSTWRQCLISALLVRAGEILQRRKTYINAQTHPKNHQAITPMAPQCPCCRLEIRSVWKAQASD